jgi:hypothetical protein
MQDAERCLEVIAVEVISVADGMDASGCAGNRVRRLAL